MYMLYYLRIKLVVALLRSNSISVLDCIDDTANAILDT